MLARLWGWRSVTGVSLSVLSCNAPYAVDDGPPPSATTRPPQPTPTPPPSGSPDAGADVLVPEPNENLSIVTPYNPNGTLTHGLAIVATIATLDPATPIWATADGSRPNTNGKASPGIVQLPALATGRISWMTGTSSFVHQIEVVADPKLAKETHVIVDRVRFVSSNRPIIEVAPGATVKGSATVTLWAREGCPTCYVQALVGLEKGTSCLVSTVPGVAPGTMVTDRPFEIVAPTRAGHYPVKMGQATQYDCKGAVDGNLALSAVQVALIVVKE